MQDQFASASKPTSAEPPPQIAPITSPEPPDQQSAVPEKVHRGDRIDLHTWRTFASR
jgi:hypothetical protein